MELREKSEQGTIGAHLSGSPCWSGLHLCTSRVQRLMIIPKCSLSAHSPAPGAGLPHVLNAAAPWSVACMCVPTCRQADMHVLCVYMPLVSRPEEEAPSRSEGDVSGGVTWFSPIG